MQIKEERSQIKGNINLSFLLIIYLSNYFQMLNLQGAVPKIPSAFTVRWDVSELLFDKAAFQKVDEFSPKTADQNYSFKECFFHELISQKILRML